MSKTKEELNAIKEEVETLNEKLHWLLFFRCAGHKRGAEGPVEMNELF